MRLGRINCRTYKVDICDRILKSDQQLPRFLVLHGNISYEFRGNLTYKNVEHSLTTLEFVDSALKEQEHRKAEGLTFKNFNTHIMYPIMPRYMLDFGVKENLRLAFN